jgi:peptidoglycan/xylan/chitin deacetylase (PgdA/CDA1 family)
VSVRSGLSAARRRMLSSLGRRTMSLGNRGPIISFTFDDFPRTAYTIGGSILEQSGARGTFYAAYGLMNTPNELGELFCADDLHSLLEKGHELATHTYSHISCRAVGCGTFCEDAERGRKAIEQLSGAPAGNFAYPFGHVKLRAKRVVGIRMASARGIFSGLNGPEIDLNLLRANALYGDLDGSSQAENLILQNAKERSWLIFYTHDVRNGPSPYGCTPALFEFAVSAATRSGSRILTVQQALAEDDAGMSISKAEDSRAGIFANVG